MDLQKFQPEDVSVHTYYSLDNKLIDAYYTKIENFSEEEKDLLQDQEFCYFIKEANKELEFILDLRFTSFWGIMTKV